MIIGEQSMKKNLRWQFAAKRILDIIFSFVALIILSPLFLLIAIVIKLSSTGPVIFRQNRIGLRGRKFVFLKFRTMITEQQEMFLANNLEILMQQGILFKITNDPRITWVGKILRKTSLDELPQLINIFNGSMSLVGPRPLLPFMLEPFPEFNKKRCSMRPGLTGLWQVRDRANNTKAEHMMKHDLEYIDSYSLLLDIKIIISTIPKVIIGTGAL